MLVTVLEAIIFPIFLLINLFYFSGGGGGVAYYCVSASVVLYIFIGEGEEVYLGERMVVEKMAGFVDKVVVCTP